MHLAPYLDQPVPVRMKIRRGSAGHVEDHAIESSVFVPAHFEAEGIGEALVTPTPYGMMCHWIAQPVPGFWRLRIASMAEREKRPQSNLDACKLSHHLCPVIQWQGFPDQRHVLIIRTDRVRPFLIQAIAPVTQRQTGIDHLIVTEDAQRAPTIAATPAYGAILVNVP